MHSSDPLTHKASRPRVGWEASYRITNLSSPTPPVRQLMSTYGHQNPQTILHDKIDLSVIYFNLLLTESERERIRSAGVDYLVLDYRMTRQLPRLGIYFEGGEAEQFRYMHPLASAAFDKFDGAPGFDRIYDGGRYRDLSTKRRWVMRPTILHRLVPLGYTLVAMVAACLPMLPWFIRLPLTLPLIVLVPGHLLLRALDTTPERDLVDRVMFAIGTSLALAVLVGLALNWSPWGLALPSQALALGGIALMSGVVAWRAEFGTPGATFVAAVVARGPVAGIGGDSLWHRARHRAGGRGRAAPAGLHPGMACPRPAGAPCGATWSDESRRRIA